MSWRPPSEPVLRKVHDHNVGDRGNGGVASLMFALGCASCGFLIGMEFGQALERKASAADTKDEEAEAGLRHRGYPFTGFTRGS